MLSNNKFLHMLTIPFNPFNQRIKTRHDTPGALLPVFVSTPPTRTAGRQYFVTNRASSLTPKPSHWLPLLRSLSRGRSWVPEQHSGSDIAIFTLSTDLPSILQHHSSTVALNRLSSTTSLRQRRQQQPARFTALTTTTPVSCCCCCCYCDRFIRKLNHFLTVTISSLVSADWPSPFTANRSVLLIQMLISQRPSDLRRRERD